MKNTQKAYEYKLIAKVDNSFDRVNIFGSKDAANYARKFYFDDILIFESSFIMLLNRVNQVIGWAKISQGGIDSTVLDIRLIAKYALESFATGVILIHNHPSGKALPGEVDIKVTRHIRDGLKTLDISLLDHIILTEKEFYSFSDECTISFN